MKQPLVHTPSKMFSRLNTSRCYSLDCWLLCRHAHAVKYCTDHDSSNPFHCGTTINRAVFAQYALTVSWRVAKQIVLSCSVTHFRPGIRLDKAPLLARESLTDHSVSFSNSHQKRIPNTDLLHNSTPLTTKSMKRSVRGPPAALESRLFCVTSGGALTVIIYIYIYISCALRIAGALHTLPLHVCSDAHTQPL